MFTYKCLVYGYSLLLLSDVFNAAFLIESCGISRLQFRWKQSKFLWEAWIDCFGTPSWTRVTMVPAIDSSWFLVDSSALRFCRGRDVATYDAWIVPREVYCWWCWAAIKRTLWYIITILLVIWHICMVMGWFEAWPVSRHVIKLGGGLAMLHSPWWVW